MISVIIPVYNVEKYVERCVKSVINQTHNDFEIILIDDGSTDKSGNICDELNKKYNNIRVIHQNNKGLSGARNSGIKYARGDYVSFIDSDDFISPEYLSILFENLIKYKADISCCNYIRTAKNKIEYKPKNLNNKILKNEECLNFYLKNDIVSAWAKLYKKSMFQDVAFPVGRINEDIFTNFKIFSKANKVVYSDVKLYYYYKNNDGITKQKFKQNNFDLIYAWESVYNSSKQYSKEIQELAYFRLSKSYFTLLGIIAYYGVDKSFDKEKEIQHKILKNFRKSYSSIIKSDLVPFNRKLVVLLMRISFNSCCKVGFLLRFIKRKIYLCMKCGSSYIFK